MDQSSQQKVIAAGFMIIRTDDQPTVRIKYKDKKQSEWKTLEKYQTKAARDRAFQELLKRNDCVSD